MNLHRLTLRAVGPYADEHTVDLASLGAGGLFLLEGPTGSGKSTVIDAIVFALYGGLAGSTSTPDRLRSHHAAPDVEPFVELVFETAAGVHRVRRTPPWRRPKARGTGTTPQNATATLVRLTSPDAASGEVLATTTQEVGGEVARIVGLSRQQFVQTVVLPQGEFAAFLRSTGEKRREVLQSLFGTAVYERTTARLAEGRVAAKAEVAEADRLLERALDRMREATGATDDEFAAARAGRDGGDGTGDVCDDAGGAGDDEREGDGGDERDGDDLRDGAGGVGPDARDGDDVREGDGLDRLVGRREAEAARAAATRDVARTDRDAAREHADEQRRLAEALARRDDLVRRAAVLAEGAESVEHDRTAADAARRAQGVTTAAAALERSEAQLTAARGWLVRARDGITAVEAAPAAERAVVSVLGPDLPRDAAVELRGALAAEVGALVEVESVEKALGARRRALDDLAERVGLLRARVDGARSDLDGRAERRAALVATREGLGDVATAERDALAEVARLDDLSARLDAVDARRAALDRSSARAADATREAVAAVDAEADLRRRQLQGRAGDLASALVAGEPCPVCGAVEHPAPAGPTDDHPDDDALEAAAALRATAEAAQGEALGRVEADRALLAEAGRASGDATRPSVDADRARAVVAVTEARAAVDDARRLDRDLVAHDADDERARAALASAEVELATALERVAATREAVERDEGAVAGRLAGRAGSVHELVGLLDERRRALDDLVEALDREATALAQGDERRAELAAAVDAADFDDVEAALAAVLPPDALRRAEAAVAAADREAAVVAAGLGDADLVALDHAGPDGAPVDPATVDRAAAAAGLADAEAVLAEATGVASRAASVAERSRAALAAVRVAEAAGDEAVARARAVVRMADVAGASTAVNVKGVTLGTYVLLRRFDDVVAAANVRLSVMSSGRYELRSSDEKELGQRSRRTGLALVIQDHATDTTRDPGSFSGGETFYASLCLALGLADVVQREAGGLQLGTLFVDEGFGSLDPETLDAVLGELGRLSASGRVIGIVSHVDELKQRVPDRLEVRRRPDGSSTLRSTVD